MNTTIPLTGNHRHPWAWPVGCALLIVALGSLGGVFFSGGDQSWYRSLRPPVGNPPSWVFGPVWTLLYALMGVSLGLLIRDREISPPARRTIGPFLGQLVLNLAWTPAFFGAHQIGLALAIILALWIAILITLVLAWRANRLAGLLLVPYLLWVTYATYLNASFQVMNG